MKSGIVTLYIVIALLAGTVLSPGVSAGVISDKTLTIESDQFKYLELEAKRGGSLEIDVRVEGEDGIDVFMMNRDNFELYSSGMDFDFYEKGSAMNINTKKYTFEAPESQDYLFVLDNTEEGVAFSISSITVRVIISDMGSPFVGTFGAVMALAVVFILAGTKRRNAGLSK